MRESIQLRGFTEKASSLGHHVLCFLQHSRTALRLWIASISGTVLPPKPGLPRCSCRLLRMVLQSSICRCSRWSMAIGTMMPMRVLFLTRNLILLLRFTVLVEMMVVIIATLTMIMITLWPIQSSKDVLAFTALPSQAQQPGIKKSVHTSRLPRV